MPSRRLTFETTALIALEATPYRMLAIERATDDEIVAELLAIASQWPKRTRAELVGRGPGRPTLRTDLICIALGKTLRQRRAAVERDGADLYHFADRARLLRVAAERLAGIDEELVRSQEWPDVQTSTAQ